jgi:hypothetical protein
VGETRRARLMREEAARKVVRSRYGPLSGGTGGIG